MISKILHLIGGNSDIGASKTFWTGFIIAVILFALYPTQVSEFRASNVSYYLLNIPLALGMALLWGYCGVLSFGHVAYFGIAGYTYGIIAGNMAGNSLASLAGVFGGLLASAVVAGIFAYFVFYSRVREWIIPILTLVLTLLLETFLGQTAGYQWRVGSILLGGYNGMTGIPSFQIGSFVFMGNSFYYFCMVIVLACYVGLRMLLNSKFGQVVTAIREDPLRTEVFGYDIRARQWLVFVLSAVLAAISGLLYVQWGNYITPSQVGLLSAALPVIWAAVGGRTSLLAVLIATIVLNWVTFTLSSQGNQYAMVIIGTALVITMVFFPRGIVIMIAEWVGKFTNRKNTKAIR
jgi:ABC-type branched-subunit amino acid transport system permease subunit